MIVRHGKGKALSLGLAIFFLAACSPDFRGGTGGPPRTAAAPLPDKPTVPVDNPFYCPGGRRP